MLHWGGKKITSELSAQYRGFWPKIRLSSAPRLYRSQSVEEIPPATGLEDKNMKNETRNDEAVSPVIATILMVAITVVLAGVLYVWAANLAESNTNGDLALYSFNGADAPGDGGVIVTMSQGAAANFASLDIKISINGGQGANCGEGCYDEPGEESESDQKWTTGEDLVLDADCGTDSEGADILNCNVTVTVFDNRENTQIGNAVTIAMDELN
jgi:flagellin-like protein